MTKPIPFTYNGSTLTLLFNGKTTILDKSALNFNVAVEALKKGDWEAVINVANLKTAIVLASNGKVKVLDDKSVYLNGEKVSNALSERILQMVGEGFGVEPLMNFLENVMQNPLQSAQEELYMFLEATNLPVTVDGHFLAYKIVSPVYLDLYTKTVNNAIGQKPAMERSEVDPDRKQTCSRGLHVCSEAYLPHYGRESNGDRVIIVKVNPRDVVAIPTDYNNAKMRVCAYEVVDELKDWAERLKEHFTTQFSPVSDTVTDQDLVESFDNLDDFDDFGDEEWEESDGESSTFSDDNLEDEQSLHSPEALYGISTEKYNQILTIRKMGVGKFSVKSISDTTGMSPRQVKRIITGEAWSHVE